ncbi:HlyD family efflux transporter periplasmic adaptor subunit [Roseateles cellulosilyticus]|uniref:HlyD family efflux transporter periplasmic adaptor subunit n=1 Tax=Pelomonas cellulosilytica TaxID=2906762 RepID=A0ABS8XR52_9BURK|nr:HlyD family efflux transporter periplasmic adaptor subunit [Pelomonas sp. P8]MCE4555221.1 HlyD family efflux transporter periplasmic adaptor subunit [Pelomonas sp. P8]
MNARQDLPAPNAAVGADAAWASLAGAESAEALCRAWLAVLCSLVPDAQVGLLLLQDAGGSYVPAAAWPEGTELQRLADIARECLATRQGVRRQHAGHPVQLAYPLAAGNALHGAVVLELLDPSPEAARLAARLTHWGAGWMADLFAQRELVQARQRLDESAFLFEVSLAALAEPDFRQAGLTLVNKLAARFGCHQVQLALASGAALETAAVSHSAWFDERANLTALARAAMTEAFDQRRQVIWPEDPELPDLHTLRMAHGRYATDSGSLALASQPLAIGAAPPFAVLLFERNTVFQPAELKGMELLAGVLAPVLEHKHARDEGLAHHTRRSLRHAAARLTDASHPGLKLGAGVLALCLVIAALVPVEHRVSAPAIVEGAVQRAAVAPFDGFLREAPARAGDTVKAGQVLARMDDRDLQLEKVRWETELEMALRKEREAMAQADRVNQRLSAAQANQARAQLDLALSKLSRVALTAPFDAVVVKGDLSQQLGAPVEMGKTLFELAPLASWRVMLKVDERDIARVQPGQGGELVLTGAPGQRWHFKLKSVTPVSVVEEGRNYFRAEAELEGQEGVKLKPNMEGVAKVAVGERSLLWVWTHRFTDWVKLALWQWTP